MLHTVLGSLTAAIPPTLRPCDNAEHQRRRNGVAVLGTVLVFLVLAVRGEDLATVLAFAAALVATSVVLVRVMLCAPASAGPAGAWGPVS